MAHLFENIVLEIIQSSTSVCLFSNPSVLRKREPRLRERAWLTLATHWPWISPYSLHVESMVLSQCFPWQPAVLFSRYVLCLQRSPIHFAFASLSSCAQSQSSMVEPSLTTLGDISHFSSLPVIISKISLNKIQFTHSGMCSLHSTVQ